MQGIIKTDDIGFLTFWSPEAEEIFGFRENEVTGWYLGVFIHSIERMDKEKRKKLNLEKILGDVLEKGKTIKFSTINLNADLKAFFNTVEISSDEEGTKAVINKGADTQDIKEYNALVESIKDKALVVTNRSGRILGVNGKFALKAKFNRMRLLNRPLGKVEGADYYDLKTVFDSLEGYLIALE